MSDQAWTEKFDRWWAEQRINAYHPEQREFAKAAFMAGAAADTPHAHRTDRGELLEIDAALSRSDADNATGV